MPNNTPFVKRMRVNGGTFYAFSSALEDVGLNINERNNIVKMSHYALLNIPTMNLGLGGLSGIQAVAQHFQNYALNLETRLLSRSGYNASLLNTVSERVFWKWLTKISSQTPETLTKCIGEISAGSIRRNTLGTFNETYVMIPTSFGQTPVMFKTVEDDNFNSDMGAITTNHGGDGSVIEGRFGATHPDSLGINTIGDSGSNYIISAANCKEIEFNMEAMKAANFQSDPNLTYDRLATVHSMADKFDFNSIAVYYSVYNKTVDKILSTNLLGILFLNPAEGISTSTTIPTIEKIKTTNSGFGTAYSFRINIKSDYMLDDSVAEINDESTSAQVAFETFHDIFEGLNNTLSVMNQNTRALNFISQQYMDLMSVNSNMLNKINELEQRVSNLEEPSEG